MKPLSGVSIEKQLETLMAHGLSPERAVDMIVTGILRLTRRGNLSCGPIRVPQVPPAPSSTAASRRVGAKVSKSRLAKFISSYHGA